MNLFPHVRLALFITVASAFTFAPQSLEADESEWPRFHSLEGSFSLDVPALPNVQVAFHPDKTITRYSILGNKKAWLALALDYDAVKEEPKTFILKYINELVTGSKAELDWSEHSKLGQVDVVKFAFHDKETYQVGQILLSGNRMATVARIGFGQPPNKWDHEDRLINSLAIHPVDLEHYYKARDFLVENSASDLMLKGLQYQQQQKTAEHLGVARVQALLAYESAGPKSRDAALNVQLLGMALIANSQFKEARAHLEFATRMYLSTGTNSLAEGIEIYQSIAFIDQQTGDFESANKQLKLSLDLLALQPNPDPSKRSSITYSLAKLALLRGDSESALRLAKDWLEQEKSLPAKASGIRTLFKSSNDLQPRYDALLGKIQLARGGYVAARRHFQKAIDGYSQLQISNSGQTQWKTLAAVSMLDLGRLQLDRQQYTAARDTLSNALRQLNEDLGTLHPTTLEGLTELAHAYQFLGDYEKSRAMFQQILAWRRELFSGPHHAIASTLASLANLEFQDGNPSKGLEYVWDANEIDRAISPDQHPQLAAALQGQGNLMLSAGQFKDAEKLFADAEQILQKRNIKSAAQTLPISMGKGIAMTKLEKHPAALKTLTLAHEVASEKLGEDSPLAASLLEKIANVYAAMGNVTSAGNNLSQSRQAMTRFAYEQLPKLSEPEQLNFLASEFQPAMHHALDWAARQTQGSGGIGGAEWLINGKGLTRQVLSQKASANWITLNQVQDELPNDAALIEIVRLKASWLANTSNTKDQYIAWLIQKGTRPQVINLGDAAVIDSAIAAMRKSIDLAPAKIADEGGEVAERETCELLSQVAKLVLEPCLNLTRDSRHLIIAPDSQTWMIPWDALVIEGDVYAIERYQISLVTSGRDVAVNRIANEQVAQRSSAELSRPALLSDPLFGSTEKTKIEIQSGELQPVSRLKQTANEAEAIAPILAKLAGRSTIQLREEQASESKLKSLRDPQYLHIATHGFFHTGEETVNPLDRCGLMLAGCNLGGTDGEDGILMGSEIVNLNLNETELVVLSACETGLGEARTTEGVASLRHAFHLAGARYVVGSLWRANDLETVSLMKSFYRSMQAQKTSNASVDVNVAMCDSKRQWLDERRKNSQDTHPVFWAAFDVSGTPQFQAKSKERKASK